jgi:hypothetical protein
VYEVCENVCSFVVERIERIVSNLVRKVEVRQQNHATVLLTQYFLPEIGAAQTRLFELGQELFSVGWEVEVLTAFKLSYWTSLAGYDARKPLQETLGRLSVVRVSSLSAQAILVQDADGTLTDQPHHSPYAQQSRGPHPSPKRLSMPVED